MSAEQVTGSLPPVSQEVSDRSRATQIRKEIKITSSRPPKTTTAAKRYNHWEILNICCSVCELFYHRNLFQCREGKNVV